MIKRNNQEENINIIDNNNQIEVNENDNQTEIEKYERLISKFYLKLNPNKKISNLNIKGASRTNIIEKVEILIPAFSLGRVAALNSYTGEQERSILKDCFDCYEIFNPVIDFLFAFLIKIFF